MLLSISAKLTTHITTESSSNPQASRVWEGNYFEQGANTTHTYTYTYIQTHTLGKSNNDNADTQTHTEHTVSSLVKGEKLL